MCRMFVVSTLMLMAFVLPTVSLAQPVSSPRLNDLLAEEEVLRAELEEIGGSRDTTEAIANAQGKIYDLRHIRQTYEQVAEDLLITQADLERLQAEAEAKMTEAVEDNNDQSKRDIAQKVAEQLLRQAAKRVLHVIGVVLEEAEAQYLKHIKCQTAEALRGYVRSGQLQQQDVSQLLTAVYRAIPAAENNRRRVAAIQQRLRAIFAYIAVERQRLTNAAQPAVGSAVLVPDFDQAGDEEERKKSIEESVRPAGRVVEFRWHWSARHALVNEVDVMVCGPSRYRSTAGVYGTDVYSDASVLCAAAVHAGAIGWGGGRFRVRFVAGNDSPLVGSLRHGIRSNFDSSTSSERRRRFLIVNVGD